MKVKILTGNPEAWVELEALAVLYLPRCKDQDCRKEFSTTDPRKEYCCYECQSKSKYRRWQCR